MKNKKVLFGGKEIAPCNHYTNKGIVTNYEGKARDNVYAIGECQVNGDKKNGRLPWPSLYFINHTRKAY
jgi:aspartate oxidase